MSDTGYSHILPGEKKGGAFPRFYLDKQESGFESERAGHPVYHDVEMVEVVVPGDARSSWAGRVKAEHRERWPQHYDAFKRGMEPSTEGYPLKEWPPMTPAAVANFAALNIHTVEALAEVADNLLQNLGLGGRQLREKAQKWLQNARDGEGEARALAEKASAEQQAELLRQTVADLQAQVTALQMKDRAHEGA